MKICIPVASSEGLAACVVPAQPDTRFLHLHDLETDSFELIDLNQPDGGDAEIAFDAIICSAISKPVFGALRQQGKHVFLTEATTVADALAEFASGEMFRIPDQAAGGGCGGGGCGGGCGGHGHDEEDAHAEGGGCGCGGHGHAHEGGGCGGHGHEGGGCGCGGHGHEHAHSHDHGHEHAHAGGCCASRPSAARGDTLRIAVTSQNRKQITEHAGKCRKFWIYETRAKAIVSKTLLELPLEQSLHASAGAETHPLDPIDLLITGSIGDGLRQRLAERGVETIVTSETDPDAVIGKLLAAL
ncbi:NifB/NifX family molybdenum-iron cluster-binding protein [Propionivibrio dicarboxylicus]|uniref:Predicted Fe-Mo cluster-binding protein, NifX family n=1 Tax=Propionivibrio dicarboxylicus TaxID=83767 RepID=A0A1G8AI19_9RHOO|nr:NifB/NifX family molybdenum-iron cluster-binding protein [Propionivibrio dicarboxylicus]SDH19950.1 Predicted Fe-Mo cluster-binding protein, NifX family [Propionivibrio dicarboxylicus]